MLALALSLRGLVFNALLDETRLEDGAEDGGCCGDQGTCHGPERRKGVVHCRERRRGPFRERPECILGGNCGKEAGQTRQQLS